MLHLYSPSFTKALYFLLPFFIAQHVSAHNGAVCYAYPVSGIKIDGNLSDWPKTALLYPLEVQLEEGQAYDKSDCSAFFQLGYDLKNRSLYIALEIMDDDIVEDSSGNPQWNSQDGVELSIDAQHLPFGSGVASYLYTKSLKHINKAAFDPAANTASWDKVEVVILRKGNKTIYEYRIDLGDYLVVGKSLGIDFQVFDKDSDGSFSVLAWGKGAPKYRNPNNLGDVILLKPTDQLATITGNVRWDKEFTERLPEQVRLHAKERSLWVDTAVDSLGHYAVRVPAGTYEVTLPDGFFHRNDNVYQTGIQPAHTISVKANQTAEVPIYTIPTAPAPDLLPAKGILHDFDANKAKEVDAFIETWQKYYRIPGVSLALIKDGQVVYHKNYGVCNSITQEPVDDNTLFEAASVTKPVFAFAVLRLVEKGMLDLDKPLYEYLPYEDIAYDDRYKLITARHVLSHRTGFPNWRWMNPDGKLDLKFTPGTNYGYSGEGFEYLKMVVQKITGKGVEQVLQEEVLEPTHLYHTFFSKNDSLVTMAAEGHIDNLPTGDGLPTSPYMAYSMYTESQAFTRFMLYLLEQKGLTASTYDEMLRLQSEFNYDEDEEKPKDKEYMGLSLAIRETPFGKSFGHSGNNGDFRCQFEVYKDLKMGYVIFTNADSSYPMIAAMPQLLVEGKREE